MEFLKVILPAYLIPINSVVTEKTGKKEYKITDRVRIFDDSEGTKVISAQDGARFITAGNGDFNVVNSTTELVWIVGLDEFKVFLMDDLEP